ncbi:helix-turn-helix domain-containing protein [Neorhizobium sp. T25_27]|uniref:helix-turn-helix domain-containing protein n=1 Tax=Neorhizobium sp. T25_27 TaxID=2093831 RepID=UPI00155E57E6
MTPLAASVSSIQGKRFCSFEKFPKNRLSVSRGQALAKNARLTPRDREPIVMQVESGQTQRAVAKTAGVCLRTVRKWLDRYRREGSAGSPPPQMWAQLGGMDCATDHLIAGCRPSEFSSLLHRHQVRDQTWLDFKYWRGNLGTTDISQLFGGQMCDCPTSCDGQLPGYENPDYSHCGFQRESRRAHSRQLTAAAGFVVRHFGLPFFQIRGIFLGVDGRTPIPLCFTPYGLRPITPPLAAGASNQTVSTCLNPASSIHAEYSAGV